jgi:hypothetical protein
MSTFKRDAHGNMVKGGATGSIAQQFNALSTEKRFQIVSKALEQFSSDADVVAGSAQLLSQRLIAVKNVVMGIDGILRPIGAAISTPLKKGLTIVEKFLDTKGRTIGTQIAGLLDSLLSNPEKLFVTLRQLAQLKEDLARAGHLAHSIGFGLFVLWLGKMALGIRTAQTAAGAAGAAGFFSTAGAQFMGFLSGAQKLLTPLGMLGFGFRLMGFIIMRVLAPLALMLAFFQLISRAKAYAQVEDAKAIAKASDTLIPRITRLKDALYSIVSPFETAFDMAARFIAPLFQITTYAKLGDGAFEMLAGTLEFVGNVVIGTIAIFHACFTVFSQVLIDIGKSTIAVFADIGIAIGTVLVTLYQRISDIITAVQDADFSKAKTLATTMPQFDFQWAKPDIKSIPQLGDMFNKAFNDVMEANLKTLNNKDAGDKNVSNHVTHINKVEIRQDFKENQEPDRIAHSLVKTLSELGKNPTQASGRSFAGGLMR